MGFPVLTATDKNFHSSTVYKPDLWFSTKYILNVCTGASFFLQVTNAFHIQVYKHMNLLISVKKL